MAAGDGSPARVSLETQDRRFDESSLQCGSETAPPKFSKLKPILLDQNFLGIKSPEETLLPPRPEGGDVNFSDPAGPEPAELATFVSALAEVFHDERWEDIEPYAARAWVGCGLAEDEDWEQVRARGQQEWTAPLEDAIRENKRLRSDLQSKMQEARQRVETLAESIQALDRGSRKS